ncbi:unnamed protein product [Camellia sinensis]
MTCLSILPIKNTLHFFERESRERESAIVALQSCRTDMEAVGMSLNALVGVPMSNSRRAHEEALIKHSLVSSRTIQNPCFQHHHRQRLLVVKAKGKKGMMARQFKRPPPPSLPKIEDDGNPRFVVFIRMANVYLWYPLSIISGGTTAKIMVAAKDNFLGKYIYKDTLARNLAAVIYRMWFIFKQDEKEIQKTALKQHRVLRSATEFKYGYKLVENNNLRSAISTTDVIEIGLPLPSKDELKTVLDKVKDFFGDAKESFGKMTALNSTATEELEEKPQEKSNKKLKLKRIHSTCCGGRRICEIEELHIVQNHYPAKT